jgi:hypothetical protein
MTPPLSRRPLAEHTRWWRQTSFEDLTKGRPKGVALRSDGKLFLAPKFAEFADANLAYLLANSRRFEGKSLRRGRFERQSAANRRERQIHQRV